MTNEELFAREELEIQKRRKGAGFHSANGPETRQTSSEGGFGVLDDKVGLALSGGGVRSAAFNLGLLQALHRSGVLRFVDYLSSVSGGSYVGAALAQSVTEKHSFKKDDFALGIDDDGRPTRQVAELSRRGNYLFRLDLIANRYFAGFVLNLIPRLSLLIAVGASVAFLWRCLDYHAVRDHLRGLNLSADWIAAVLPAALVGIVWFVVCILSLMLESRPLKTWSNRLFWTSISFLLIGVAVLIGNGDISLRLSSMTGATASGITWQENLRLPILILAGLGLIPIAFPKRLITSGVAPRHFVDSWVFFYTSFVLFLGIPLIAIGIFAKENVSGFVTYRDAQFVTGELQNPENLLRSIISDKQGRSDAPMVSIKNTSGKIIGTPNIEELRKDAELVVLSGEYLNLREKLRNYERRVRAGWNARVYESESASQASFSGWLDWKYLTPFRRTLAAIQYATLNKNDYAEFVHNTTRLRSIETQIVGRLNRHLASLFSWTTAEEAAANIDASTASGELATLAAQLTTGGDLPDPRQRPLLNRLLLEQLYPSAFSPRTEILRAKLIHYDQSHRLIWFVGSAIVFLISARLINPNTTTLHEFYRDRLAVGFLSVAPKESNQPFPKIPHMELRDCTPHDFGAPYPLIHAAICEDHPFWRHPSQLEANFGPFLLSPLYCGSKRLGFSATADFPDETLTVADAMAISGAALSPNYFVHHIVMAVMSLLNLRMGKWLPNPSRNVSESSYPHMLQLIWDDLVNEPNSGHFALVTDGGHHENLGLEALLDRRCRYVIVSDAGCDPLHSFDDLAKLMRRYELQTGVKLLEADGRTELDISGKLSSREMPASKSRDDRQSQKTLDEIATKSADAPHFFQAAIRYPSASAGAAPGCDEDKRQTEPYEMGRLIYIKPCLTGDEPIGVKNFAIHNAEFPHDSTSDQAFSQAQFEAYRQLGFHTGREVAAAMAAGEDLWKDAIPFEPDRLFNRPVLETLVDQRADHPETRLIAAPVDRSMIPYTGNGNGHSGAQAIAVAPTQFRPDEERAMRARVKRLLRSVLKNLRGPATEKAHNRWRSGLRELLEMGSHSAPAAEQLLQARLNHPEVFDAVKELIVSWGVAGTPYLGRILNKHPDGRLARETLRTIQESQRQGIDVSSLLNDVRGMLARDVSLRTRIEAVRTLATIAGHHQSKAGEITEIMMSTARALNGEPSLQLVIEMALHDIETPPVAVHSASTGNQTSKT